MKRANFYLPETQLDQLKALSDDTGAPMSELVRRAVAMYVEKNKNERNGFRES